MVPKDIVLYVISSEKDQKSNLSEREFFSKEICREIILKENFRKLMEDDIGK
jgi:hypothetical protein